MEEELHEAYGSEIPDMEYLDMSRADDVPAKLQEYEEMKKRLEEMEEEAEALRKIQAEVEKEMGVVQDPVDARSVYVGNVDYACTPVEVQQHFQSCGTVNRVTIPTNVHGQPKGYAYVEFLEAEAVEKAVLLSESELHGRLLNIAAKRTNVPGMKHSRGRRFDPYMNSRPRRIYVPPSFNPYMGHGCGKVPRFRRPVRHSPYY